LRLRLGVAGWLCGSMICVGAAQNTEPRSTIARILQGKTETDRLVGELVENAAVYRATLPSLTAHETIESKASMAILHFHATAEAIMRVMRKTPDGPVEEVRQITTLNGKPVQADKHVTLPTDLKGGFGGLPGALFRRDWRSCFDYVLMPHPDPTAPLKLLITLKPEAGSAQCAVGLDTLNAIALVDAETHQLKHLEWTIAADEADKFHRWPFASVDLAPAKVGDKTFWLPTEVVGRGGTGKTRTEWVSHYSDYHQFAASAKILPSGDPPEN
jgi:hypothetical protein